MDLAVVVEATAALSILLYFALLWLVGRWNQKFSDEGFYYSALTGICVGAGTIAFFSFSERGSALLGARNPSRRRGDNGNRRNVILSQAGFLATTCRYHLSGRWPLSIASQQH